METQIVDKSAAKVIERGPSKYAGLKEQIRNLRGDQALVITPNGTGIDALRKGLAVTLNGMGVSLRKTSDGKLAVFLRA